MPPQLPRASLPRVEDVDLAYDLGTCCRARLERGSDSHDPLHAQLIQKRKFRARPI